MALVLVRCVAGLSGCALIPPSLPFPSLSRVLDRCQTQTVLLDVDACGLVSEVAAAVDGDAGSSDEDLLTFDVAGASASSASASGGGGGEGASDGGEGEALVPLSAAAMALDDALLSDMLGTVWHNLHDPSSGASAMVRPMWTPAFRLALLDRAWPCLTHGCTIPVESHTPPFSLLYFLQPIHTL